MKPSLFLAGITAGATLIEAKSLWSSTAAAYSSIIKQAYPVGNGRLGGLPFGAAGAEKVTLNIDSLWSGGPFEATTYNGGNPTASKTQYLPGIRDWIFKNGTGNVSSLLGSNANYGSYRVFANLSVAIDGVSSSTKYNRSLDLGTGIHTTVYTSGGNTYTTTVYCSYPDQVCVYDLVSSGTLPKVTIDLENQLSPVAVTRSCSSGSIILSSSTQAGPPAGMQYSGTAKVLGTTTTTCKGTSLVIAAGSKQISIAVAGGTNYDQKAGTAASKYTFTGKSPLTAIATTISAVSAKSESTIRKAHVSDYQTLIGTFTLQLPDAAGSSGIETSTLISRYASTGAGDPYLESLLFDLGRHLFISSSRDNSLPPGLQGRWSPSLTVSWGADFHANINFQMNHWGVDITGLGELQVAAFNYMQDTWVPRGTETAQLLYGAPGWVTHDEMNIFGHTGMKYSAQWANYPAAAAWMMEHVYDHFSYSQDTTWFNKQGYPLIKGVAQFWLSQLQVDKYSKDNSLVVNPCNSPEHGPTTFACTHFQQLIHQLFSSIITSQPFLTSADTKFAANITTALSTLDKGLHIGTWGEVKEWKIPDSLGYDFKNDTHRHLSELVGWYPGYSISSFASGYTSKTIQNAVRTTLQSRGAGNGADANAGWEKVWRSACWARLNDTDQAYYELKYAIEQNWAANGFSMYSGANAPFQIDANFGLVGAMTSFLVVDLPLESGSDKRTVVLGPAIPARWGGGSVKGLRVRGGGSLDFAWDATGSVTSATAKGLKSGITVVNKKGTVLVTV